MTHAPDIQALLADLTPDEKLELVRQNPALHFGSYLQIYDKGNQPRTAHPNILQRRMNLAYMTMRALGIPVRILVCKIRQCGGTTFSLEIAYTHCMTRRTEALVISNIVPNSEKALSRLADYRRMDSFPWGIQVTPKVGTIQFSNGSCCEVTSAVSDNPGISRTRQFIVMSEVGKWPKNGVQNDKKIAGDLLPSVSSRSDTVVIAESTPEGAAGWFYDMWQEALYLDDFLAAKESGVSIPGNGWVKVFAAWFEFEENRITGLKPREVEGIRQTMTDAERNGIADYGWTFEQIAWRRATIANECGGSEKAFEENYAADDESCWLASGRPRFDMRVIARLKARAKGTQARVGFLMRQDNETVAWADDQAGDILIWEMPRVGMRYIVSGDPATGEDWTDGDDPDRHSVQAWRAAYADEHGVEHNAKLVARVRPPFQGASDITAMHIAHLSWFYGGALCALEMNMGIAILERLMDMGVPLYKREVVDDADRDKPLYKIGFKTKDRSLKRQLTDCLAAHLRESKVDVLCPHWLDEAARYIIDANGTERAGSGHDDDVIGGAIGLYCLPSATLYVEKRRRRQQPKDRRLWRAVYPR